MTAVRQETPRAYRLVLDVRDWPGHLPGQHVDVRLTAEDGYTAQRAYSIASAADGSRLELVVELLAEGEVSPYLTGELRAGDTVELRGPVGRWFVWRPGAAPGPLQLIAGGSGVVPFLAMLDHRARTGDTTPVRLLYSARGLDDVIARDVLAAPADGVEVTLALTRAAPAGWPGPTRRVDREIVERYAFDVPARPQVLVCGPSAFVEAVTVALVDLGHSVDAIRTERFGASGV